MHTLFDIAGKKAIVTGGTRGLGYGMAEGLMEAGCEVCIVGTSEKVFSVAEDFCKRGFRCHGVQASFYRREEVFRCFNECVEKLGGDLDILVVSHGIQRRCTAEDFPMQDWDDVINVNLNAVFILCQQAARLMLPKGYGKMILVSSMAAFFGGQITPAYAAAKGGLTQMAKEMSNDWISRGINVNCLAPGYMATDMCAALHRPDNPRDKEITNRIPIGRWGTGDDMKGPCLFLASHASDYLGGAVIPVDGGYLVK